MRRPLLLLLAAALSACGTYPRKYEAFHPKRKASCGDINIRLDEKGAIIFEFVPAVSQEGCCGSYGWIQHVTHGDSKEWNYDNGAAGGGTTGAAPLASPSDPKKQPQLVSRPPGDGQWRENPWYGGTSKEDPTDEEKDAFRRNPQPQLVIGDKPGGRGDCFRTQLVCADTGKVLFTWAWCDGEGFPGNISSPPPPAE